MNTVEILLTSILVAIMTLVAISIMDILSKHHWETRSRLEKLKKYPSDLESLKYEHKLVNSWKGHLKFLLNAFLYGSIISFALYHIIKFLTS